MLSMFIDKVSIPDSLDERVLQRKESSKLKARKFHDMIQEKEDERQRQLLFEEEEVGPARDADGSWSGAGRPLLDGGNSGGAAGEVRKAISFCILMCM